MKRWEKMIRNGVGVVAHEDDEKFLVLDDDGARYTVIHFHTDEGGTHVDEYVIDGEFFEGVTNDEEKTLAEFDFANGVPTRTWNDEKSYWEGKFPDFSFGL